MPMFTEPDAIHSHIRSAVNGGQHLLFLATGQGRVTLYALAARLMTEGAQLQHIGGGSFQVASLPLADIHTVSFLTLPKAMIERAELASFLAHASVMMGEQRMELQPDQDIVILSDQPALLTAALHHFAGVQ